MKERSGEYMVAHEPGVEVRVSIPYGILSIRKICVSTDDSLLYICGVRFLNVRFF